ncbi:MULTISPECIES: class II fumarate hydratase [Giesbergeria]|uniref:Fumarate hydratase class II n=1 Tax=Giesbergeria sinuosa TaxID=80883 RepID=A0ABV9QDJ9_9BURK
MTTESSTSTRTEFDTLGPIEVPAQRLWGAQTQRALVHFAISEERMAPELLRALAQIKRACAYVNHAQGRLQAAKATAIIAAADELINGEHADEFPLSVWQSGSGTQTHMNVNEVLANRASELLGGPCGQGRWIHPYEDVNLGQASNDVFPTAMHVAAVEVLLRCLLPALQCLRSTLTDKAQAFADLVKLGRTHLQDAAPLTLGQEISGWAAQLQQAEQHVRDALPHLCELALGGTVVGTGLHALPDYAPEVAQELADLTGLPLVTAPNKFEALASCDALVHAHGALKTLATSLMKIANDIRWMASGPRAGLGEITIPENESGAFILPGKANPTQCEALMMLCCQVLGNDVTINIGGASGNFQLNAFRPVVIHNFLQSVRLLAQGMQSFHDHCVVGIEPQRSHIAELLSRSLVLVAALRPHLAEEKVAEIARKAYTEHTSLREAGIALGYLTAEQFDAWVDPGHLAGF